MRNILLVVLLASYIFASGAARAQVPVQANPNHEELLASADPRLAANKRLVYDFFREVIEGGHMELAEKYLAESYIQHNPTVPTGRAGFVEVFSKFAKPKTIEAKMKSPVVSIIAEGNLVVLSFVKEYNDPADPTKKYTTTWFDMLRIEDGKLAEHWDGMQKK
ncbi:ester cyclase [Pseudomonas sp. BLCC-B13]|uniref:nuclear transport factor 2 family protein n=1 Tax=Pseudomonas sp. BLCC-B13 TaxID=3025314 RepID=UPI00234E8EBB|nr:nuclear transport factor 2 family protein [Pseudomonas sp. BLCC-B13]MDC7827450.1 ester cyclase [Pseudomonas sp. BLCC-B13]